MNNSYDIVFVVLVYRNTDDLKDFFLHNHIKNSHTIVVNSYYDDKSEGFFSKIAEENGASFISVPNKGYGAGNNRGVEYALEHFDFEFLVNNMTQEDVQKLMLAETNVRENLLYFNKLFGVFFKITD